MMRAPCDEVERMFASSRIWCNTQKLATVCRNGNNGSEPPLRLRGGRRDGELHGGGAPAGGAQVDGQPGRRVAGGVARRAALAADAAQRGADDGRAGAGGSPRPAAPSADGGDRGLPELEDEPSGTLRLTATADFATTEVLSEILAAFGRRHPRITGRDAPVDEPVDLVKERVAASDFR